MLATMSLLSLASPVLGHETRMAFLEVRALRDGDFVSVLKTPVTGTTAWPIEVRLPATCKPGQTVAHIKRTASSSSSVLLAT